jgi:DNA polymerase-3 subunit epsilon
MAFQNQANSSARAVPGHRRNLPGDLRKALEAWRSSMAPELDEWHYHVRYVVVDIATSGPERGGQCTLLGISAGRECRVGSVMPADAFTFDLGRGRRRVMRSTAS